MKKSIFLLFVIFSTSQFFGQEMTGSQLLEKAIEYHDPQWKLVNIFRNFQCNDENPY